MRSALVVFSFAYDLFHPQYIDPGVCADLARVSLRWRQLAISSRSHEVLIYRQQGLTASSSEHLDPRIILFALGGSRCRPTLISGVRPGPPRSALQPDTTAECQVLLRCAMYCAQKNRVVMWSEKETLGRNQNLQRNEQCGGIHTKD